MGVQGYLFKNFGKKKSQCDMSRSMLYGGQFESKEYVSLCLDQSTLQRRGSILQVLSFNYNFQTRVSNKLLCSSWIYRWNCFKFQVHTEIFSRGINDRNCGIYSIPKSLSVVTSPNYTKIETKIKNNFYYMINIKYKKNILDC